MQQQQFFSSVLHNHHHYQPYPQRVQEHMGIYDRNYGFFPLPDQTPFYPVPSAYGFPVYPEFNQPGYDFHDFFLPSRPLQYYYGHPAEAMYSHQNENYYLSQEQNLQWPRNLLQEFDQGPDILSRFRFAPEDETVMLDLDAEEDYPLGNQLQESDDGGNILSRLIFTPEDETAMVDLDAEENYPLGNQDQLQESDQGRNIRLRISLSFPPEGDTPLRELEVELVNEEGNPATFRTTIPADDPIVEFLLQSAQEDGINENNGLPEATISEHLKTRNYQTLADQEPEICVVCQCEYENGETIGTLECGHEYHVDCIKRWLMKKNVCPLCKREGVHEKS